MSWLRPRWRRVREGGPLRGCGHPVGALPEVLLAGKSRTRRGRRSRRGPPRRSCSICGRGPCHEIDGRFVGMLFRDLQGLQVVPVFFIHQYSTRLHHPCTPVYERVQLHRCGDAAVLAKCGCVSTAVWCMRRLAGVAHGARAHPAPLALPERPCAAAAARGVGCPPRAAAGTVAQHQCSALGRRARREVRGVDALPDFGTILLVPRAAGVCRMRPVPTHARCRTQ